MASIYKRKNKDGTSVWRAVVRIKGYPSVCNHFDRKQEADDWAKETERKIKVGQFSFDQYKKQYTFQELVEHFLQDGALEHHRSADDTRRHLSYWKDLLGTYSLVHITSELLGKERQTLADTPTLRGTKRTPSTVNRYMASLSSLLSYAVQNLGWITENPTFRLIKLKENPGRDRVLSQDEIARLLAASKQSKFPYLYCIVLLSLTTGARQGELLNLEWRHVDFENQIAYIKESKNGRPRSIPLCKPVTEELQKLYQKRNLQKPLVFASKTAFGRIDIKKHGSRRLNERIFKTAEHMICAIHFAPMQQRKEPLIFSSRPPRDTAL